MPSPEQINRTWETDGHYVHYRPINSTKWRPLVATMKGVSYAEAEAAIRESQASNAATSQRVVPGLSISTAPQNQRYEYRIVRMVSTHTVVGTVLEV